MARRLKFSAFSAVLLAGALLMLLPAAHAAHLEEWRIARTFLYHGVFFAIIAVILALALADRAPPRPERYHLLTLVLIYVLLPVPLAMPLAALTPIPFGAAYFEMVSSLTTTGASVFDRYWLLPQPLHLWRALVGWFGGLMILVAAFAVLAPLNLGGFELVRSEGVPESRARPQLSVSAARSRVARYLRVIAPAYVGFTLLLSILLTAVGDRPFVAICHAMATLSTSGISPVGGPSLARSGLMGEALIAVFLLAAISHRGWTARLTRGRRPSIHDPEVQLMLISVLVITLVLFLRSFAGAIDANRQASLLAAGQAIWGGLFTVLSHLTTAGFESRYWLTMQLWSRLDAPGVLLLGVAAMGGGIATTAGGIKLLRLYVLYRHGVRELERLVHPSTPGHRGRGSGLITENGIQVAFVFVMLFLTTLAVITIAVASTGYTFERSLTLAVAALTTTGPLLATLNDGSTYRDLSATAQGILCGAMIVGRVEALVILALFNPSYWRR